MRIAAWFFVIALVLAACAPAGEAESPGDGASEGSPATAEGSPGGAGGTVEGSLRVALGDIEGVETLNLLIALERVRERGIDVELIEFAEEDLAAEAVLGGQADVTLGAPYAVIQETGAPIRIICQLQTSRFFAIVDAEAYPDWQALDGETFTVHSRGSTTEAMALLVQQEEGIEFGEISFVSGAEVRATALVQGNVQATFLDIPAWNFVQAEAPDRFHELPLPDVPATDEAFVANVEWLAANPEVAQVLLEETLTTWNSIIEDPNFVVAERDRLGLAEDLEPELVEQIVPYYEQAAEEGVFATDCGGEEAARADFEFYGLVGQVEGDPATLNVEDFWDLAPAEAALETVGQ
ncbi:MAG: ABC transporter substrate-binding protein [Chloroflexota bacterium]|nr:ABC transporter substrate-binding protein [Chloroflexota bacterium]